VAPQVRAWREFDRNAVNRRFCCGDGGALRWQGAAPRIATELGWDGKKQRSSRAQTVGATLVRTVRPLLFTSIMALGVAGALGATAQTQPPAPAPPANPPAAKTPETPGSVDELVVTGSRIKRSNFTTSSPIQVITSEDAALQGAADTAQLLQQSTVANNAAQINNFFSGFVTTGGPGANTLSLRGLGAQRTLILIDGKTLGPAGVGGTVGPIDLNTIPESIIDHVEILKDGASSIYGSDAVAGVVNIITKKDFDGGTLHAIANPSEGKGGNTYEIDGNYGKTFNKGYFTIGFDIYRQDPLRYGDRPFFSCSTLNATNPATGASADPIDPATGKPKCFNLLNNTIIDAATGTFYAANGQAMAGGGVTGQDLPGFQAVGLTIPGDNAATLASQALVPYTDKYYNDSEAISPVTRYTLYATGGYDLTPNAQLYTELLFNRRDSQQVFDSEFFTIVNPNTASNPGFYLPEPVIPQIYSLSQRIDYGRAVLGVKGDVPNFWRIKNWTYDIYGQFSSSMGRYSQDLALNDRVNATAGAGDGQCDVNAVAPYGYGLTMAQAEPGVACVPVNFYAAVQNGGFTPQESAFLYANESGRTVYDDYYLEGTVSGDLFKLPAGPVGSSFGFKIHREELDDTPPADIQDGNAYNYSSVGRTKGAESIEEVFGELAIPIINDLPFAKRLDFSVSGRLSNYQSYGSNETFKLGLSWEINDWLAFRASHGTAFRAPALYEQFLADQIGYLGQSSVDPCYEYGISGVSLNVKKNCASQGIPSNYAALNGSSIPISTGGGSGLKPETSVSNDFGFVLTPKWNNINLKVSVDWYSFNITNQIQEFGAANILYQCYDAPNFPNNSFCSLFSRDLNPASPTYLNILSVSNNYVNVATQIDQGLDLNISYVTHLTQDLKLTIDSRNAWTFYTTTVLLGGQVNNYLGQIGQPGYVGQLSFKFEQGPWTFNWFVDMIGHSSDNPFVSNTYSNFLTTDETVSLNHTVGFYSTSTLSLRYKFKQWAVEFGCKNIFDTDPPVYSAYGFQARIGTAPLTSQYDWVGRSYFLDLKRTF
jgi:iron complex outermembrane receptor protein